jgi:hypothetical protein
VLPAPTEATAAAPSEEEGLAEAPEDGGAAGAAAPPAAPAEPAADAGEAVAEAWDEAWGARGRLDAAAAAGAAAAAAPPVVAEADRGAFGRLLLTPTMMDDHLPDRILEALERL